MHNIIASYKIKGGDIMGDKFVEAAAELVGKGMSKVKIASQLSDQIEVSTAASVAGDALGSVAELFGSSSVAKKL